MSHVDSAVDGFTDNEFAVIFRHRFQGLQVSPAQLIQTFTSLAVGHAAPLDQGVWLDVAVADVEHHFAQLVPRQCCEGQLMCADGLCGRRGCVFSPTAPPVLAGRCDHLGLDGILVNVAQQRDEVPGVAHGLAAESVVEERPQPLMPLVVIAHVGHANALHHCADVLGGLGDEQVDVVVHQTIGMDVTEGRQGLALAVLRGGDGAQDLEELASVLVVGKDVSAVDTAQHHVVKACVAVLSAGAWHRLGDVMSVSPQS